MDNSNLISDDLSLSEIKYDTVATKIDTDFPDYKNVLNNLFHENDGKFAIAHQIESFNHFMDIAIISSAEWDIAQVMKQMFKDKYVCVSFTQKQGSWYVFKNHRWEPDKGISLRMAISSEMYMLFSKRYEELSCEFHKYESTDTRAEMIRKKLKRSLNRRMIESMKGTHFIFLIIMIKQ
jgi:hypothetical protein